MKLKKMNEVQLFLDTANACKDGVWLTSPYGDKYNLKSLLTQYLAVAALLGEHGDEMELWCDSKEDEYRFLKMFADHPELF